MKLLATNINKLVNEWRRFAVTFHFHNKHKSITLSSSLANAILQPHVFATLSNWISAKVV